MAATNERMQNLKARGIGEFKRFVVIFVYLWIVFGLFALNRAIILRDLSYLTQGFALMNAAIFAKVMLIAEDLKLGTRFQSQPRIYPVVYKTRKPMASVSLSQRRSRSPPISARRGFCFTSNPSARSRGHFSWCWFSGLRSSSWRSGCSRRATRRCSRPFSSAHCRLPAQFF